MHPIRPSLAGIFFGKNNSHSVPIIQRFQKKIPNKTSIISKKPSVWKYSLTSAAFKFRLNCSKVITPPLMAQKWPQWLHECVRQFTQLKKETLTTSLLSVKKTLYSGVFAGGDEEILDPKTCAKFLLATFSTEFLKQGLDFEQMLFLKPRLTTTGNCFFMVATPNGQSNEYEQLPKQKNAIFNRNTSLLEKKN